MKTETKNQTKQLEVGLGVYPNALGTYVATIEDPNPISNEIVGHIFGDTRKDAEEKAEKFVTAINMHDELVNALKYFVEISRSTNFPTKDREMAEKLLKQAQ